MTHDIIKEVFSASPEMSEYIAENAGQCMKDLPDAICGAPISLVRKTELLRRLACCIQNEQDSAISLREQIQMRISAAEEALEALEKNPGDIFIVYDMWYDEAQPSLYEGKSALQPCINLDDVMQAIRENIVFATENYGPEELDNFDWWFELEKWELIKGENGTTKYRRCPWSYTLIGEDICFARLYGKEEQQKCLSDLQKTVAYGSFASSPDLNLPIPFAPGDIIEIDCRPFAPKTHALILTVGDNRSCCAVQIMTAHKSGKLCTSALKHLHFFYDNFISKLSALYRITRYDGELAPHEKRLYDFSNEMKRCSDTKRREAFGDGIWYALQR